MKTLVTGATGFLGSWLTRQLIAEGHDVRVLRRGNSDLSELDGLEVEHYIGDVTNPDSLKSACQGVDAVFHLAGLIAYSRAQRPAMDKVNVGGTQNVLEACKNANIQRLVYLSSVVAVGASFDGTPLNEQSPYNVGHLNLGYFETKHKAEQLVKQAADAGKVDAVMLNPSTVYGPGDARKGSRKVQLKVARGQFPFYTSGGVNVVAVQDVIQGIISAWKKGRTGERYILAGENLRIRELFAMIAKEAGSKPPSIYLPNPIVKLIGKVGDQLEARGRKGPLNTENAWTSILYHWFDASKAKAELDFQPRPAREAIAQSIQWSKDHHLLDKGHGS